MFYRDVKQNKSNKSTLPEINYLKTCFCSAGRKIFFHGPHAINKKNVLAGYRFTLRGPHLARSLPLPGLKLLFCNCILKLKFTCKTYAYCHDIDF